MGLLRTVADKEKRKQTSSEQLKVGAAHLSVGCKKNSVNHRGSITKTMSKTSCLTKNIREGGDGGLLAFLKVSGIEKIYA